MKAYLEIVELKNDIITASVCGEDECCEWGCPSDFDQIAGNY